MIPGHRGPFLDLGGDALGDFLRLFRRRPVARAYGVMLGVEIEDEAAPKIRLDREADRRPAFCHPSNDFHGFIPCLMIGPHSANSAR